MNMKSLFAVACGIAALTLSGCHYDEPYYPARSHYQGAYHGQSYGRSYDGGYGHGDCYDEHRAAHHAEHDYYDHGY